MNNKLPIDVLINGQLSDWTVAAMLIRCGAQNKITDDDVCAIKSANGIFEKMEVAKEILEDKNKRLNDTLEYYGCSKVKKIRK